MPLRSPAHTRVARARRWLGVLVGLFAILLVATTGATWRAAVRIEHAVADSQGVLVVRAVRARLTDRAQTPALDAILAEVHDLGVVWAGLSAADGRLLDQAGAPHLTVPALDLQRTGSPTRAGGLYWLVVDASGVSLQVADGTHLSGPAPPNPRHGSQPPPGGLSGEALDQGGVASGDHRLLLAYTPSLAADLTEGAQRTFWLSLLAAAMLAAVGVWWWRQSLRAEAEAEDHAHRERLAALGEMSAVLAHEIRNPLAAVKGHAQLLDEALGGAGPAARTVARIVNAATRLETVANDLLDFVRLGDIRRQPTDPARLLALAADDLGASLQLDARAAPVTWPLDPSRMGQVLANLVRNAVEAAPDTPVDGCVQVHDGALEIRVRDHGPGLPADLGDSIFEPFQTTRTRGTGLGLAVSRRIVVLHGGTLTAHDHPDGGAVFTVRIPRA